MSQALTPPFLLASGLLLVAGIAKLRTPAGAAGALVTLGILWAGGRVGRLMVRAVAVGELGLGAVCLLHPGPVVALALAGLYLGFAATGGALVRRRASCGCFGDRDVAASALQVWMSLALAVVVALAASAGTHGAPWLLSRPPATAAVLMVGLVGAVYAAALAYTELARAWFAWSER